MNCRPLALALLKFLRSGYFLISPAYELQRDDYLSLQHSLQ
jgi:hypothetical protein